MSRDKRDTRGKSKKKTDVRFKVKISWIVIAAMLLSSIVAFGVDLFVGRREFLHTLSQCLPSWVIRLAGAVSPNEVGDVVDAFRGIWEVTITIAIFIFEIGGNYQYGITWRQLVAFKYKKGFLVAMVFAYLALFPLIYLCKSNDWRLSALVFLVDAYAGLIWLLWFTFDQTRSFKIKKLLSQRTKETLIKRSNQSLEDKIEGLTDIHSQIDSLEITNVIEHVDYADAEDTRKLVDTLQSLATDEELLNSVRDIYAEHVILMTWVARMIEKSGICTEYEKERTMILLSRLWAACTTELEKSKGNLQMDFRKRVCLSYSVQILLPFINIRHETAFQFMLSLWKKWGIYSEKVIIYLLLYMEFKYWFENVNLPLDSWLRRNDVVFRQALDEIRKGRFQWEEELAKQFWLDWSQYDLRRSDIGLQYLNAFCADVKMLKEGKYDSVSMRAYILYTIVHIVAGEE